MAQRPPPARNFLLLAAILAWGGAAAAAFVPDPAPRGPPHPHPLPLLSSRPCPWARSVSVSVSSSPSSDDAAFMEALRGRVEEVADRTDVMPLLVLDSLLPRQVLGLAVRNPGLLRLLRERIRSEVPTVGVMGTARVAGPAGGGVVYLRRGVEAIVDVQEAEGGGEGDGAAAKEGVVRIELRAGRRFEIEGDVMEVEGEGWTEARVRFLDSTDEEEQEGSDALAAAISKAGRLTAPTSWDGSASGRPLSAIDRWIELATERERTPGQIEELVRGLGPVPPADRPTERALYVGALINPLPAMGVAVEIRPALLTAEGAERRVDIALEGILGSIRHMDGSARLWRD